MVEVVGVLFEHQVPIDDELVVEAALEEATVRRGFGVQVAGELEAAQPRFGIVEQQHVLHGVLESG